jgi:hypothetical protein
MDLEVSGNFLEGTVENTEENETIILSSMLLLLITMG